MFKLGEALVGVQPLSVQNLLGIQIISFLDSIEKNEAFASFFKRDYGAVRIHLFDRSSAEKVLRNQ